jgi:hypothetical protein
MSPVSYFRLNDMREAVNRNGLKVVEERRFGLSIPFGDKIWPAANFCVERLARHWAGRRGAEIVLAIERKSC